MIIQYGGPYWELTCCRVGVFMAQYCRYRDDTRPSELHRRVAQDARQRGGRNGGCTRDLIHGAIRMGERRLRLLSPTKP